MAYTTFSTQIGQTRKPDRFNMEVVAVNDKRNANPLYIAPMVTCLEHTLPENLVTYAWDTYLNRSNGLSEFSTDTDSSEALLYQADLKILRHGSQIFRVFSDGAQSQITLECLKLKKDESAVTGETAPQAGIWDMIIDFAGKKIDSRTIISGNISVFNHTQVKFCGNTSDVFREQIEFSGTKRVRVKYWYTDPAITIVNSTGFYDFQGNAVSPPRKYSPTTGDEGNTAYGWLETDKVCWGIVVVEYPINFAEYQIIYTIPAILNYTVQSGEIVNIGQNTSDMEDVNVSWAEQLDGITLKADRFKVDESLVESFAYDSLDFKKEEDRAVASKVESFKLFPLIKFSSAICEEDIYIFARDGSSASVTNLSISPELVFTHESKNIPAVTVYEKRQRERIYPEGAGQGSNYLEVDHVEEYVSVDIFGNVKRESMEKRKSSSG
ncbi:MAG: hypothetical protein BWK78_00455 [Thiotrichaceae bacterium IS1]|nr:MAG: hypothetical protein BWK78_00455 [Thiotrichaceae bacterium IS1]